MHKIVSYPQNINDEKFSLIEQETAPIIFLTSASTDIATFSKILSNKSNFSYKYNIRALLISDLKYKSQIDHYLSSTALSSKLIIVRLLGGLNHWSYGIEQLNNWKNLKKNRNLIIISGTLENELELHKYSTIDLQKVDYLAQLFRYGGVNNLKRCLNIFSNIIEHKDFILDRNYEILNQPHKWDWKNDKGPKVGVILYSSYLNAEDINYANAINKYLREQGLSPRALWVTSLRNKSICLKIISYLKKEKISSIITTTSFSSVSSNNHEESILWDKINVPVFQFIVSSETKDKWKDSSLGLNPIDLTLQIVMPEIDGRITTRPCVFKEYSKVNKDIGTQIHVLSPYDNHINWSINLISNWIKLKQKANKDKKITIVLANYPVTNGRIANGVGLDTPNSLLKILIWLKSEGYELGEVKIPLNDSDLIKLITSRRTNDPLSSNNKPLDYLPLNSYMRYWEKIIPSAKEIITNRWLDPNKSIELEPKGFPIHGVEFGNISILIQPSRGYDPFSINDLHSPDLPPPHRYLAQYYWINSINKSDAIINLGKHGSLEWLPGKGIGLSEGCFPHIVSPPLPNIYPFIVNDPGEGSQAKRRSQAVIIDHLTPPIGKSGIYGNLLRLESLFDEYYETKLIDANRNKLIIDQIINLLQKEKFPFLDFNNDDIKNNYEILENIIDKSDSYLCEIKESQIRTGLHIFGILPENKKLSELILSISRAPSGKYSGFTQILSTNLGFDLDPWNNNEYDTPTIIDNEIYKKFTNLKARKNSEIISFIENFANELIEILLSSKVFNLLSIKKKFLVKHYKTFDDNLIEKLFNSSLNDYLLFMKLNIIDKLFLSAVNEKNTLINSLSGNRVKSGPSGAPTRGNIEVLPTGKNFYSVDIRGLPTEAAWDLGKRSSQNIIDLYHLENGEDLSCIAISIWATSTMRNGGEDVAQILALMGVKPIWDFSTRRLIDLEAIPIQILGRSRVDVIVRVSGLFRDSFPQLIELLYNAQVLLSNLNESERDNPYIDKSPQNNPRIFGSAPGAYGAGLQELINSSEWNNINDIGDVYLSWSMWAYKGSENPINKKEDLKKALKSVELVVHNQDNKEHDILDSDDYYQFQGGIAAAIESISSKKPSIYISDHSRISRPRVRTLKNEIDKVVRSRLLNPKWIEGIKKHGYKGAFEISASVDYLFGYDATTNSVNSWCYEGIYETFLINEDNKNFILENNPWCLKDIAERLLEASNRGLWKNSNNNIDNLKTLINELDSFIESS